MTIQEIERRLRMAAPDEPAVLPPLMLPLGLEPRRVGATGVGLRTGWAASPASMRLGIAVLLLLGLLVGAIATGTLRLEQLRGPFTPPGVFAGRGMELTYPDTWVRLTPDDPFGSGPSMIALLVSSTGVDGCALDELDHPTPPPAYPSGDVWIGEVQTGTISDDPDRMYACLIRQPMAPGETRLIVSVGKPQIIGVGPFGDFAEPFLDPAMAEWEAGALGDVVTPVSEKLADMPAWLVVRPSSVVPGADEVRTWVVASPAQGPWPIVYVQAVIRGPDLEALREQADAIARSLRFDDPRPLLADEGRDAALARAIDDIDRGERQWQRGGRHLGCLPRTPGTRDATITSGPGGRLAEPLAVTCTTAVERTDLRLWRATLTISWTAQHGAPAGRWSASALFDGDGTLHGWAFGERGDETVAFPGSMAAQLPPPGRPPVLAPGTLVVVLAPGSDAAVIDVDTALLPPGGWLSLNAGDHAVILSGPERWDGRDWYLASTSGPLAGDVGWLGAEADGRPLLTAAGPWCPPVLDATELAYVPPEARPLCAGDGEITLGPVQVEVIDWHGEVPVGSPEWLARPPLLALHADGIGGLDRSLPAVVAPALTVPLPPGGWAVVTGHYGDPASAGCRWPWRDDTPRGPIPADVHARWCADQFVITGFVPVAAPSVTPVP